MSGLIYLNVHKYLPVSNLQLNSLYSVIFVLTQLTMEYHKQDDLTVVAMATDAFLLIVCVLNKI